MRSREFLQLGGHLSRSLLMPSARHSCELHAPIGQLFSKRVNLSMSRSRRQFSTHRLNSFRLKYLKSSHGGRKRARGEILSIAAGSFAYAFAIFAVLVQVAHSPSSTDVSLEEESPLDV